MYNVMIVDAMVAILLLSDGMEALQIQKKP
jgi:hypothetical protein